MEIGSVIHGEPGRHRVPLVPGLRRSPRCCSTDPARPPLPARDVIAFVNGLGGTPLIELYLMYNEVSKILAGRGISPVRSLVGPYITSLDMAGCSVTLLRVDDDLSRSGTHRCRHPRCGGDLS
jgi:dihydroxyacetone kinase-like protein